MQALNYGQYVQLQRELKRVREQLAAEKARNRDRPAKEEDVSTMDPSLSMAIIAHNESVRKKAQTYQTSTLEHVRRLEALLNQLKSFDTIEAERHRYKENSAHLKEQCSSKDKFIHSARMIIKLREAAIESLQKRAPRSGTVMNPGSFLLGHRLTCTLLLASHPNVEPSLKQEIEHLRIMVENHPDLLKHVREVCLSLPTLSGWQVTYIGRDRTTTGRKS